ncbi:MAG: response regulator, partial [Eubacteriales bacterium]|nr:response regulator [Eubacteriales bacterium]
LRSMDCGYVQGYYYAKPMSESAFVEQLKTVAVSVMETAAPARQPAAPGGHDQTLLIVDDAEINRAVLASVFGDSYNIVEKGNGREALEYLQKRHNEVTVVLLDLLMPVMDGFELLKRIRSSSAMRELPVIVTSQGDVSAEERALDMGADDFIAKPYSPRIVKHRVLNVVKMSRTRRTQQRALDETRRREQTLLDSIPGGVAIYHLKKDGRVAAEYVSDGLARLCGYSAEEFIAHLRDDARVNVVNEDLPRLASAYQESARSHGSIHELQHIYTKNGGAVTIRFDANVVTDGPMAEDDEALLYAVHTKVSDDAESLLMEQTRYRYILDNLDVAYFELDADGTFYSSDKYSLYSMSEKRPADILHNTGTFSGVHPEDLPLLFDFFRLKQKRLPKITTTLRLKMKDGSYRWTELLGFFDFDAGGQITRTFGILRDVDTEWQNQNRKLQEALAATEKANQAKTNFLARVSHEMRTPLNGILGIAELLSEKRAGEDIQKDVEELRQSGHYLLDLINDTLDVNTIEKGRMQLHPTVCDGKTAFQAVIAMVKPVMDEKQIRFNLMADNLPFTMLYIDVGRVEQAVLNVLNNAIKFTPEGGTIDFVMENLSSADGVITDRVVIRDTGIGIGEAFLPHIFEPFAQEHLGSKTQYSGTGLGMTIARQCIELMGGSIEVASQVGRGTEVTIVLPMPIATREQLDAWHAEQEEADLGALRGKRILLCEDHPLNAKIAIRLLEKKNLTVTLATNGKVGVERFAASPEGYYAAILMDIRMPVMDGLEAARTIRALKRKDARSIPIIAMTANALSSDVKNSINAGMNEHLGKPVEPARLYRTLARLITRPIPFAGRKVLVVDDIEMNRSLVRSAIQDTYTVLEAASGEEALRVLQQNPDMLALVTDVQMPQMDGKELIRRIRADKRYDHLAILANTIYGDHRQEDELLALGANDFVYKPTSPQVVQMRLEHILRNQS